MKAWFGNFNKRCKVYNYVYDMIRHKDFLTTSQWTVSRTIDSCTTVIHNAYGHCTK